MRNAFTISMPRARIHYQNTWGAVWQGPSWLTNNCWIGDWMGVGETVAYYNGQPAAITRYVTRRDCRTKQPTYEYGEFMFVPVDVSPPLMEFQGSFSSNGGNKYYMSLPLEYETLKLITTTWDNIGDYRHQIYVVPDGRLHYNKCVVSLASLQACLDGDFRKYDVTSAVPSDQKVKFYFSPQHREMVYDGYVRVLYVIRDNSYNLVTWNWNVNWVIGINDVINPDVLKFKGHGNDPLFKNNGPIQQSNIDSIDWIFSGIFQCQFLDPSKHQLFERDLFQQPNMLDLPGVVEFVLDPTSDCASKGIVTGIDPYTTKLTFSAANAFNGATFQKCQLKVCPTANADLNGSFEIGNDGCFQQTLCFGTCSNTGSGVRPGLNWTTQPVTVLKEFRPQITYELDGLGPDKLVPFMKSDQSCYESMSTRLVSTTAYSLDFDIQQDQRILFWGGTSPGGTHEFYMEARVTWCGYQDDVFLVPPSPSKATFIVASLITAEYLEWYEIKPTDSDLLKFNQPQTVSKCDATNCDKCAPSCQDACFNPCPPCSNSIVKQPCIALLHIGYFSTPKQAKFKKKAVPMDIKPCDFCKIESTVQEYNIGEEYLIEPGLQILQAVGVDENNGVKTMANYNWQSGPIVIECGSWTQSKAGTTIVKKITISNVAFNFLSTEIQFECIFASCSNIRAVQLGEFNPKIEGGKQFIDAADTYFYITKQKETIELELEKLELFCESHVNQNSATINLKVPGKPDQVINEAQAKIFGVTFTEEKIQIFTTNVAYSDHAFEITLKQFSDQETGWFYERQLKIHLKDGRCRLTQAEIDQKHPSYLELRTSRAGYSVTKSLNSIWNLGSWALQEDQWGAFCGKVQREFYDPTNSQPFIELDWIKKEITLKPEIEYEDGTYDKAVIRFSYDKNPNLHYDVIIISIIDQCQIEQAEFPVSQVSVYYHIGKDEISTKLPEIKSNPACELTVQSYDLDYAQKEDNLLRIDINSFALIVKKTDDLTLFQVQVLAKFTVYTHEYPLPQTLSIRVKYYSTGPEFEGQESLKIPPVMCSQRGANWFYKMPSIVSEDQQVVQITLIQDQLVGDIFRLDWSSRSLSITRDFKDVLIRRDNCPIGKEIVLTFQLTSSVIGVSRPAFIIEVIEDPLGEKDLESDIKAGKESLIKSGVYDDSLTVPSAQIDSISMTGDVIITFDHPVTLLEQLSRLQKVADGQEKASLQVTVDPVEGQTSETVAMTWAPKSLSKTELHLQLEFDQPYEISMFDDHNVLKVVFVEGSFFKRLSDGRPIPDNTQIQRHLPQQLNIRKAQTIQMIAETIQRSGQGSIILSLFVQQFVAFSMNNLLSQVRNLAIITHLMIMQLNYAASASYFFSFLFEFVTYAMIPTDDIYGSIFGFESDPLSEQADNIGYGSRFVIENTGSLLIYLFVIAFLQLIFLLIVKKLERFKRLNKWAKRKRKNFFWAGAIDFFNEMFLCVAFSLGINYSHFVFSSVSESINNLFAIALTGAVVILSPMIVFKLYKQMQLAEQKPSKLSIEQLEGGESDDTVLPTAFKSQSQHSPTGQKTGYDLQDQSSAYDLEEIAEVELHKIKQNQSLRPAVKVQKLQVKVKIEDKLLKKQRKKDKKVQKSFGSFVSSLADRSKLSAKQLTRFVCWNYIRKALLAIFILSLQKYPVMQVLSSVLLNFFNLVTLLHYKPYSSSQEQLSEQLNDIAQLLTLYCLMLFVGQYVGNKETLSDVGDSLIYISVFNLVLNLILILQPIAIRLVKRVLKLYQKYQNSKAKRRNKKLVREQLRARTKDEIDYGRRIELRVNVASENQSNYQKYENLFDQGQLNDKGVAIRTQQHLNLENQLDSDYASPRDSFQENEDDMQMNPAVDPYTIGTPYLLKGSQLLDQFAHQPCLDISINMKDLVGDFGLEPVSEENQNEAVDAMNSAVSEKNSEMSQSEFFGSQYDTKTDFWGNVRMPEQNPPEPQNSLGKHRPKEHELPHIETQQVEDLDHEQRVSLVNTLQQELMHFSEKNRILNDEKLTSNVTKKDFIKFINDQIESWIAIVIDTCQSKIEELEKLIEEKTQLAKSNGTDIQATQESKEAQPGLQQLQKVTQWVNDIFYELLEIETIQQEPRQDFFSRTQRDKILDRFALRERLPPPPIPSGEQSSEIMTIQDIATQRYKQQIGNMVKSKQTSKQKALPKRR